MFALFHTSCQRDLISKFTSFWYDNLDKSTESTNQTVEQEQEY